MEISWTTVLLMSLSDAEICLGFLEDSIFFKGMFWLAFDSWTPSFHVCLTFLYNHADSACVILNGNCYSHIIA